MGSLRSAVRRRRARGVVLHPCPPLLFQAGAFLNRIQVRSRREGKEPKERSPQGSGGTLVLQGGGQRSLEKMHVAQKLAGNPCL